MDLWQILVYILIPILLAYIGYTEYDRGAMKQKLNKTLTGAETEHLIEILHRPMEVLQQEAAIDIKRCNDKLDKIEDLLRNLVKKS